MNPAETIIVGALSVTYAAAAITALESGGWWFAVLMLAGLEEVARRVARAGRRRG